MHSSFRKTAQVIGLGICCAALSWAMYASWADLKQAVTTVQSLFGETILANGTAAQLQYALQESQREYSYVVEATDFQTKAEHAEKVRASDKKVSLLQGVTLALVTLSAGEHSPLKGFWEDWEAYTEARDSGLAHALQGKAATASEARTIISRFEKLTSDVHGIEQRFHAKEARQAQQIQHSLVQAGLEMACTLLAAAVFLAGLVWNNRAKRQALRLLLVNNIELERARVFEWDRSSAMELIGGNEPLESVLLSIVNLVEHQLAGGMCSISILRDSYDASAAPNLPFGYQQEILEFVKKGAGSATTHDEALGTTVLVNDIENDPRALPYRSIALRHGLRSSWCAPVLSGTGKLLGTVAIYHRQIKNAGDLELALLGNAAQLTRIAAEQRSLFEQLTRQARVDTLTELPNRLLFQDRLQNCLADARCKRTQTAVLWVDLDRFKQINDTLGHRVGDLVLRHVARLMTNAAGPNATVARIGGDEFTVILPNIDSEQACDVARKITSSLAEMRVVAEHNVSVSASVGIALYPDHGEESASLLRNADAAMYEAKRLGRNAFVCFTEALAQQSEKRALISKHVGSALEREELELHYQPQSDVDGNLVGFEALLRWHNPVLGKVEPMDFIPAMEEAGSIVPVGNWVLREACRMAAGWMVSEGRRFSIAVNVSLLQLVRENFADQVQAALIESGLPAECLELELTESILMQNASELNRQIARLRALGIRMSIDDFGTGYSSLSYLQHLRVDAVKIDRSFVNEVTDESSSAISLIQAMVAMAHELNLKTVAEGVETEHQMEVLRNIGCDMMQGYLIQRPMPACSVPLYLRQTASRQLAA